MGLVSSSVVRGTPEDKTYDIYLAHGRVQREGLCCGTAWKLGLGQRSRMTREESNRKAYIVGQREAGTQVYRSRKRSTIWDDREESNGKAYVVGQREAGTQVYRSGTDGVVRGHWMSYLQMVCGTIKVYVLYVYSTEPVLSAELCLRSDQRVGH